MKKSILLLALSAAAILVIGCTSNQKVKELTAQLDSLKAVTQQQDSVQASMDYYMETLASTLDSIRVQEGILTVRVDENGKPLKRQQIKDNLKLMSDVIARQRERISKLEAQLGSQGKSLAHYKTLVTHLQEELDRKEADIARMQQELNRKDETIATLNTKVTSLEQNVEDMSIKNKEQQKTLEAQSKKLNAAYVVIATKKELKKAGLLKKGVLNKGLLNPEGLDMSCFKEVDVRKYTETITLNAYKPKVLTAHPAGSYKLVRDEESYEDIYYFTITDPASFWSVSHYLIIQL